jgi:1-acyl-sn-glycerol-3-phosphate acyltransferase
MENYQHWNKVIPYQMTRGVLKLYIHLFRLTSRVGGMTRLPAGPKILALNHPNASDGFHLPLVFPERFFTLVQGNLFDLPVIGWLLRKSQQIPVIPGRNFETLRKACEVLYAGYTLMIFPEGRLNPDQAHLPAGPGAVCLSFKTGAPIIPVGIYVPDHDTASVAYWGNDQQHTARWQIKGCCYIQVGQPWYPALEVRELDGGTARRLTETLMEKIYTLSSQAAQQARLEQPLLLQQSEGGIPI